MLEHATGRRTAAACTGKVRMVCKACNASSSNGHGGVLPVDGVKDRPFFDTGGMLDSGRYFWTPGSGQRIIDIPFAPSQDELFPLALRPRSGLVHEIKISRTTIGFGSMETLVGYYAN